MMNLLNYALYLDVRDGSTVADLCRDYGMAKEEIQERVDAATLCFEHQVERVEFLARWSTIDTAR